MSCLYMPDDGVCIDNIIYISQIVKSCVSFVRLQRYMCIDLQNGMAYIALRLVILSLFYYIHRICNE